ncbi:hypothetical protein B0F90DRAFT_1817280 [Multifurca ochricompacta]|uniref:Uncharacterized protein n=1 Tax=Multifurca ochricompacta TaxID=376703 RepID=A0AAD4QNG4_9AGAM|nr:hypothetical protein B0F90DRAFT_1817280 [Multifurca ochricompacta]
MASCYWTQPSQLHPWFKSATLKRQPSMFPRSESPSPVDEYDSDARIKRQRRITPEQMHSKKRKLPSPPQSPTEDISDAQSSKRQRCTTLEHSIEGLSLTPPMQMAPHAPEFATRLPTPVSTVLTYAPDFSSSQWLKASPPTPGFILSPPPLNSVLTPMTVMPASMGTSMSAPLSVTDTIMDVKMRSSSWFEPEKDRIVVTDLDASSDDEADTVDDAPKLPRPVLQALFCGPERWGPLLAGIPLVPSQPSPSLDSPSPLEPIRVSEPRLDEAMDVEQ